ncbi:MAG: type VI secretion system contractile sheath large subunit [Gluconacetobacter diazotrophicus]|nr:type VI secretion system contractile sheath large subunit [Gluconacetobacter diazotrophicus]
MSESRQTSTPAVADTTAAPGLLDQVLAVTKQTEPDRAKDLVRTFVEQAMTGTVTFDRNLTITLNRAVQQLDALLSEQLNAVMHDPRFLKLEGSWRGLHYLVMNTETSTNLKIRVVNASKRELHRDLTRAVEFDQSLLFRKIYENEFGTPGGEPYGALVGDYEWSNHPEDIEALRLISNVSAAAFAPFISAASASLMGFEHWNELSRPRDLAKIFDTTEYLKWRGFRDSEDSRFVALTMPRVLARLPYGETTRPIDEFAFEEAPFDPDGTPRAMQHENYCWMNSAFVMATRMTDSFARSGFCVSIRGAENGGKVDNLPQHVFRSDDGDLDAKCPTEIGITDRREYELSKLGFLPLCHYKNEDYAVFFGSQTAQKPKTYDQPEATANAAISARLPYIMAMSRFSHYLKVMARDKIGSFMEVDDCERWLNKWIMTYVNSNETASPEMRARYPLRDARVEVREIPGNPGAYNAIAHMRPWLQLEELTVSMRMVARIPQRT